MKRLLFSLIGLAAFAGLSAQCAVREVPLVQRANASTLIVEGTVTEQYSYWNSTHTMIYTANKIELYKIFKGTANTDAIEVITEGGTVDMDRITVEPSLQLTVGDVGVFTCIAPQRVQNNVTSRNALPQFEAYAGTQGFVQYDLTSNTASDHFRTYSNFESEIFDVVAPGGYTELKARPGTATQRIGEQVQAPLVINGFLPATVTAGTGSTITIDGAGFGAVQGSSVVRFRNADDGGATFITPLASQYISWSSTQIVVEVPQNAGTGIIQVFNGTSTESSSGTLTISYAHLNVDFDPGPGTIAYQTDHVNDNGTGGYTWRMNTGFDGDAAARASFMRAFDSWRCATLVNWSIGSTTSTNDAVSDGTNIICFDGAAPLPNGVLGVCYSYWSGCASGPTIVWFVNELDIIFDEGSNISPLTWEYGPAAPSGSEYDFETVAVHELGHGHQLGHVIAPGAIMHYAISNGSANRSLGVNDLAGGQFVQSKSVIANVCGPGAMSNTSCGTPPTAAFSGAPTTVCAGGTVSFSDQTTGAPTSWSWSFPGGTPAASTAQNPTITYNTPGVYNVQLTATNASGSDAETIIGYITVNAAPSVGFSVSPSLTICAGDALTLSGTGASSYAWSGGITDGVAFNPSSSTSYTVTGTDGNGCTATDIASVTVNIASVNITRNPVNGIVCTGNQATLTAGGAQSYQWTGGITNGVPFTPPATTTYTVTATAANGCTATAQSTITVQNCVFQTQLNSTWCGATNCTISQTIVANTVSGATNYEFWFENAGLGYSQTRVKGNGIANIPLSWIAGLQYGVTYTVRVRCFISGQWQAYGPVCTLTMAPQTPQPQLTNCAATGLTYASQLSVTQIAGAADYEYEITNAVQPLTTTRLRGSGTTSIPISWFTGIQYGRTYNCRVRALVGGVWSSYGPTCTFTMAAAPTTQLTNCGMTGVTSATVMNWTAVTGSSNYRVNVTNPSLSYNVTRVKGSNGTSMPVSQFPGLLSGNTYTVTVSCFIGGTWTTAGPACTITMGGNTRLWMPGDEEEKVENTAAFAFGISMYPNPLADGQTPTLVISGADQKDAVVTVMDLSGRVITSYMLYCEGADFNAQLSGFPDLVAGMYIMRVTVGDQIQSQRFVAE
jgi:PKD repeat protein